MEITLAIIKPHVVRNTPVFNRVRDVIQNNFKVLHEKEICITKQLSEKFYGEHKEKFFYNRLSTFMSSGPSHVLILEANNCISKWRDMLGPTKVYKAVFTHPFSLRGSYGLSDTRNACHGSDSEESATREISILFPELDATKLKAKSENS